MLNRDTEYKFSTHVYLNHICVPYAYAVWCKKLSLAILQEARVQDLTHKKEHMSEARQENKQTMAGKKLGYGKAHNLLEHRRQERGRAAIFGGGRRVDMGKRRPNKTRAGFAHLYLYIDSTSLSTSWHLGISERGQKTRHRGRVSSLVLSYGTANSKGCARHSARIIFQV